MYTDITIIDVDLVNLELGAINAFTDLNPLFWLAVHDHWIAFLVELGRPHLFPGLAELTHVTEFLGDPTDYSDIPINEFPFIHVPAAMQLGVMAVYPQLNEQGLPNASN